MVTSVLGLLALISIVFVLAYRYHAGRQHPRVPEDRPGSNSGRREDSPAVSVYGEECAAVWTAGSGIYVAGNDVAPMEGDTIRVDGRSFTVTGVRRPGTSPDAVLITDLQELP